MKDTVQVRIQGAALVRSKIKETNKAQSKRYERGVVKAALYLQYLSQLLVPVDTGYLKNSARTTKVGTGFDTKATVSYSAEYAIYVHEDLQARHKPGKQAKYLEQAYHLSAKVLQRIIREETKVK